MCEPFLNDSNVLESIRISNKYSRWLMHFLVDASATSHSPIRQYVGTLTCSCHPMGLLLHWSHCLKAWATEQNGTGFIEFIVPSHLWHYFLTQHEILKCGSKFLPLVSNDFLPAICVLPTHYPLPLSRERTNSPFFFIRFRKTRRPQVPHTKHTHTIRLFI